MAEGPLLPPCHTQTRPFAEYFRLCNMSARNAERYSTGTRPSHANILHRPRPASRTRPSTTNSSYGRSGSQRRGARQRLNSVAQVAIDADKWGELLNLRVLGRSFVIRGIWIHLPMDGAAAVSCLGNVHLEAVEASCEQMSIDVSSRILSLLSV